MCGCAELGGPARGIGRAHLPVSPLVCECCATTRVHPTTGQGVRSSIRLREGIFYLNDCMVCSVGFADEGGTQLYHTKICTCRRLNVQLLFVANKRSAVCVKVTYSLCLSHAHWVRYEDVDTRKFTPDNAAFLARDGQWQSWAERCNSYTLL